MTQECTQIAPRERHIVPDFGLMFHLVLTGQQSLVGLGFVAITRKDNPTVNEVAAERSLCVLQHMRGLPRSKIVWSIQNGSISSSVVSTRGSGSCDLKGSSRSTMYDVTPCPEEDRLSSSIVPVQSLGGIIRVV
jgi:hypothetical protein